MAVCELPGQQQAQRAYVLSKHLHAACEVDGHFTSDVRLNFMFKTAHVDSPKGMNAKSAQTSLGYSAPGDASGR